MDSSDDLHQATLAHGSYANKQNSVSGRRRYYQKIDRLLMLGLLVITVGVIIAVLVGNISAADVISDKVENADNGLATMRYEHVYHVSPQAMTPIKDQGQRGTCWAFTAMSVLEASYRANGYKKGFLEENEYVTFSEQAYAIGVVEHCGQHKDSNLCYGTGPNDGSTEDAAPEWLYYMPAANKVLPETACPYFPDTPHEFECPDREAKLEKNPISFTVEEIKSAYTIPTIKKLIFDNQLPLSWSYVIAEHTYSLPCTSDVVKNTQMCTTCVYPDPSDPNNLEKCKALYTLPSYDKEGYFSLHGQPLLSGGHGMTLMGYNDNLRVDTGAPGDDTHSLGGFILKNNWGTDNGHSLKFLTSEISEMEEAMICPNERSARRWIPANVDCMKNKADPLACANGRTRRIGEKTVPGATVLTCVDLEEGLGAFLGFECKMDKNYVLAEYPTIDSSAGKQPSGVWTQKALNTDGLFIVRLLEFDPSDPNAKATLVVSAETSWYGLSTIFKPKDIVGKNDPEQCGFYFLPYQYFQEGTKIIPASGHDSYDISFLKVNWNDSSYLKNKGSNKNYDYSYLEASTHKVPKTSTYDYKGPMDLSNKM